MGDFVELGMYRGLHIYMISLKDFLSLEVDERFTDEYIWCIIEDKRLIHRGKVFGQVSANMKQVTDLTPISYGVAYGKQIRAMEAKVETKTKTVVITERDTVEKLRAEGETRFKAVVRESEEKYRNTGLEIEKKLKLLEIERDALIRKVKR